MRRALVCAPVALLFLASVLPSYAQRAAAAGERVLAVAAGAPLAVECELRVEQRAEWRLDGAPPPADMRASELPAAGGAEGGAAGGAAGGAHGLTARLEAARARPQHAGLYTCAAGAPPVRVVLRPHAATQHDTEPATAEKAEAGVGAGAGAGAEATLGGVLYYEVRTQLSLDCRGLADDPATLVWTANGTNVFEIPALKDRVDLKKEPGKLIITGRSHEDDFGNYTCAAGPGLERSWEVRGKPRANLSPNTNVVEGQKLKLTCKLTGKPYPAVRWLYSNTSAEASNDTLEVTEALDARVTLAPSEQGVPGAQLVLEPAQRSDAGWFTCVPLSAAGANSTTVLRVKDMYAALWPFLGICAEVFVLCAVILVYEKRRAKPELDDSDTDNHDPKKS